MRRPWPTGGAVTSKTNKQTNKQTKSRLVYDHIAVAPNTCIVSPFHYKLAAVYIMLSWQTFICNLTFMAPCIVNVFFQVYQQDATLYKIFYYCQCSTCRATIYLQLIQNRYMFRSFTVLQCSHQHCVQPVASM